MTQSDDCYTFLIDWQLPTGEHWLQRYDVPGGDAVAAVDKALADLTSAELYDGRRIRRLERVPTGALEDVPIERVKIPLYRRAPEPPEAIRS